MASNKVSSTTFLIGFAIYVLLSDVSLGSLADEVQIKNCGGSNFTASYSPSKFRPGDTLNVTAKFTLPMDISMIQYTATLYLTDGMIQILYVTDKVTCDNLPPKYRIFCPFRKGFPFHVVNRGIKTPIDLIKLAADNYTVKLETWNQDKQKVVCAVVNFEILDTE